jgi:hypothetical protein
MTPLAHLTTLKSTDSNIGYQGALTNEANTRNTNEAAKGKRDQTGFDQQQQARDRINSNPAAFAGMSELEKAMLLQQSGGMQSVPQEAIQGPRHAYGIKPDGSGFINFGTVGPHDSVTELNYPPIGAGGGSAAHNPLYIGTDPKSGYPIFQMPGVDKDGNPIIKVGDVPIAAKPTAPKGPAPWSAAETSNLAKLHGKTVPEGGFFGMGAKGGTDADKTAYQQQLASFVAQHASPEIQPIVLSALNKQSYNRHPVETVANALVNAGLLTPEQVPEFSKVYLAARGH